MSLHLTNCLFMEGQRINEMKGKEKKKKRTGRQP
jgi:hypothetical protein